MHILFIVYNEWIIVQRMNNMSSVKEDKNKDLNFMTEFSIFLKFQSYVIFTISSGDKNFKPFQNLNFLLWWYYSVDIY